MSDTPETFIIGDATLILSDCIAAMQAMPDNSVDSVVTDPPYGIRFMGKAWDGVDIEKRHAMRKALESHAPGAGPNGGHKSIAAEAGKYDLTPAAMRAFQEFSREWAAEAFRVLKPGGHLVSFSSGRTYHRMVSGIEDAGFEIRDQMLWIYGSGFPKSLNVSKAIDKAGGVSPRVQSDLLRAKREASGMTREAVAEQVGCTVSSVRDWEDGRARASGSSLEWITPSDEYRVALANLLDYSQDERVVAGVSVARNGDGSVIGLGHSGVLHEGGNTDASKQWQGWGTALKPAHEPICLARKPLVGTVIANVLAHGTGALNIDACRVGVEGGTTRSHQADFKAEGIEGQVHATRGYRTGPTAVPLDTGRWPANIILSYPESEYELRSGVTDALAIELAEWLRANA